MPVKKKQEKETLQMLEIYRSTAQDLLYQFQWLLDVKLSEKFAGAEETYTIEALMHDGKAYNQEHLIILVKVLRKLSMLNS